jgi:replicative DNA helicase
VNSLPDVIAKEKWDFTSEVEWFIENNTFILSDRVEDIKDLFRQALKNRSKVICIDYIELVNMSEKFPSEERRLNEYSITIQKWAKKYKIAVIDLSQLSNTTQKE